MKFACRERILRRSLLFMFSYDFHEEKVDKYIPDTNLMPFPEDRTVTSHLVAFQNRGMIPRNMKNLYVHALEIRG